MDQILNVLGLISGWISDHKTMVESLLGMLFVWAKVTPTSASGAIVSKVQGICDFIGKCFEVVGHVMHAIADLLADVIKSDGAGGTP